MAADVGTGTTIGFGTSTFVAEIMDINLGGVAREAVNTSHHGTTDWHTFIPTDIADGGELTFDINFDPDLDYKSLMEAAAETITITFPLPAGGLTPATLVFSGFCTGQEAAVPFEDKMTGSITVKIAGEPTWTAST